MQKMLFLDYLKSTTSLRKDINLEQERDIFNWIQKIKYDYKPIKGTKGQMLTDSTELYNEFIQKKGDMELFFNIEKIIREDTVISIYGETVKEYVTGHGKNYIFSNPLTKALARTNINVPTNIMPDSFSAYIEMPNLFDPDGCEIKCVWVAIKKQYGVRMLNISATTKNPDGVYEHLSFAMNLDHKETLEECYESSMMDSEKRIYFHSERPMESGGFNDQGWIKTIINGILYIVNAPEEMIEKLNEFATKRSKRDRQQSIYTPSPFIPVGEDFIKLNLKSGEEFEVKGHFRWQRHGKSLSRIKCTRN